MVTALAIVICLLLGYLIGSINFAVIVARTQGVDILREGSKNPGATNVKRVLGNTAGNLVFGLDAVKGCAGTFIPFFCIWLIDINYINLEITFPEAWAGSVYPLIAGFAGTILGHCFSVFLKFKGGKGVASSIGGLLIIMPYPIIIGAVIWVIVFQYSRYVSLASLALGLSLPISTLILSRIDGKLYSSAHIIFAAAVAIFNIWTHRANIMRLRAGVENRFVDKN